MKIKTKWLAIGGLVLAALILCIIYQPYAESFAAAALSAVLPLIVGCVLAYIVNLIMRVLEKWYFPRAKSRFLIASRAPVCMVASVLILLAAMAIILVLVVPQLVDCIKLLVAKIPAAYTATVDWLEAKHLFSDEVMKALAEVKWEEMLEKFLGTITTGLGSALDMAFGVVSTVIGGVVTAFIGIIFSVYLLLSKKKLGRQANLLIDRFLSEKNAERFRYVVKVLDESFRKYIIGQTTEAVILGVLCALGMWALRLPYPAMIGALIAFTSLIPIAGAYIGGAIGAFMIFTDDPFKALIFIIYLVILQQLEGNLIYPKVVGDSIGLPAMWVLAAITIGGGLFGIMGMLISVPITATLYRILKDQVKKGKPKDEDTLETA